jgi:hypothetical protein
MLYMRLRTTSILPPQPGGKRGTKVLAGNPSPYLLPDEYALAKTETPLDVTSVKILTTTFSSKRKHKPQTTNHTLAPSSLEPTSPPQQGDVDYNSIEIHQHTSHSTRLSSSPQTHHA